MSLLIDCAELLGQADASVALESRQSGQPSLDARDVRAEGAGLGLGPRSGRADCILVHLSRRARHEGRGRIPAARKLAVLLGRCLLRVEHACKRRLLPTTRRTASSIGFFFCHKSDYKVLDTWNVTGLRGTGSCDVEVRDAFVADHMTVAVGDLAGGPTPGSKVNPNPLYALPVFSLFPLRPVRRRARECAGMPRRLCRGRASSHTRLTIAPSSSDFQSTQIKIAEASAKIDAARLIMRSACLDAMEDRAARSCSGHGDQDQVSARWSLLGQSMHRCSVDAVRGERSTRPVHDGGVAAAIPRCARDQLASRVQLRCGRDQLWTGGAWACRPRISRCEAGR